MQSRIANIMWKASLLLFPTAMIGSSMDFDNRPSFTISPGYSHFSYKEMDSQDKLLDKEEGNLPSIEAKLEVPYQFCQGILETQYLFRGTFGKTQYQGAYWDNPFGSLKANTDNQMYDGEANVGYSYYLTEDFRVGAYAGLGYHQWKRSPRGKGGYDEVYSWFYVPIGVRMNWQASDCLIARLDAAYLPMFGAEMDIDLGSGTRVDLGNRPGWRVAADVEYNLGEGWSVGVTPWYSYAALGKSKSGIIAVGDAMLSIYEPRSEMHAYGADLNIKYVF